MSLEVNNLKCIRAETELFSGLSFVLKSNQLIRVEGQNGSGKTTLLRTLCGLHQADQGEVIWQGSPIKKQAEEYLQDLFFLGHQNAIKADLSALENLDINIALAGQKFKAKLWILDEPFVALDGFAVKLLQDLIANHVANDGMVVLTTHQDLPLLNGEILRVNLDKNITNNSAENA